MPLTPVTTYYLEILDPRDVRPKGPPHSEVALVRIYPPMPELNRFFYTAVGGAWWWHDRLPWTYRQWLQYLNRPELQTWMLTVSGIPAGYFELESQPPNFDVEIAYFGLLPAFVGKGLGGYLLTCAIEQAWNMDAGRVWLHTCTLDHPHALANYQGRGMRLFKQETAVMDLSEKPSGFWPGDESQAIAEPQ